MEPALFAEEQVVKVHEHDNQGGKASKRVQGVVATGRSLVRSEALFYDIQHALGITFHCWRCSNQYRSSDDASERLTEEGEFRRLVDAADCGARSADALVRKLIEGHEYERRDS